MGAFASVELISVVGGIRRDSSRITEVTAVRQKSFWGLKGSQEQLLALTDPVYNDGTGVNRTVVDAVSTSFLRSPSRSITSRLTYALQESNRALCGENSRAIFAHRRYLSAVCAYISPEEAYFAQVGPSLILLVRRGELRRLGERALSVLSAGCLGRDFGFEIHYSHTEIEPGDIVIISSPGLAKVANRESLLDCLSYPGPDSLADSLYHLHENAAEPADFSAIIAAIGAASDRNVVRPSTGHALPGVPQRAVAEDASYPNESTAFSPNAWRSSREKHSGAFSDRDGLGTTRYQASPLITPDVVVAEGTLSANVTRRSPTSRAGEQPHQTPPLAIQTPPPPVRDVVIEFNGSRVDGGAIAPVVRRPIIHPIGDRTASAAREGISTLANRLSELRNALISWIVPLMALGVFLALGFAFVGGYQLSRERSSAAQGLEQQRPALEEVLQLETDALATSDPSLARRLLAQANKLASSVTTQGKDDRDVAATRARIKAELDKLGAVTRLSKASVLVDLSREVSSAQSLSMNVQDSGVYVLDSDGDRLFRFLLDSSREKVQQPSTMLALLHRGDSLGEVKVKDLVAIAWVPAGGAKSRGTLLAFDSSGMAFEYDPSASPAGISPLRATGIEFLDPQITVKGYAGNLYVLDPQKGTLKWYPQAQGGYGNPAYNYFNPETSVDVSTAIDFALDGSLYLLHRNGLVQRFFAGRPQPFDVVVPDGPITAPTSIFASQASQYVYVVDAANSRVVQLNKDGSFERQFLYGDTEDLFHNAKSISVDEKKGLMYVLSGRKILALALETKQP